MTEADFLAAIDAAPDDSDVKLVYADWLEQLGDPRADLVRIADELWRSPIDLVRARRLLARRAEVPCEPAWHLRIARPSFAELRRRVEVIAALDPTHRQLASYSYGYNLWPTLSTDEVTALEQRAGCALPADFRGFLLEVAGGGAGPGHGLHGVDDGVTDELAQPFAPTDPNDASPPGALEICELTCGSYYFLIISGPYAGEVWLQSDDGWTATGRTFLAWYLEWLDTALWSIARSTPDGEEVFYRDPALVTEVILSHCKLTVVPDRLRRLTSVRRLDLRHNSIRELPAWIGDFPELAELELDRTQLRTLPDAIAHLRALRRLSCSRTRRLKRLPDAIGGMTSLTELDLHDCALAALPETIGELVNLRELRVHTNRLTALPAGIGKLRRLTTLDVSSNQLAELPATLAELPLRELSLRANRFRTLPDVATRLPLEKITLSENALDVADAFRKLATIPTLRHVDVSATQLTVLPKEVGLLTQIESLHVGWNNLYDLPRALAKLVRLRSIHLGGNDYLPRLRVFELLPHVQS